MSGKVMDVTGGDIAQAVGDTGMVLFDLWSPYCTPCRTLAPVLDDLAADFTGEVRVCKADVSGDAAVADQLSVRVLPTLVLFRDGAEIDRVVGARSRSQLSAWLESHL